MEALRCLPVRPRRRCGRNPGVGAASVRGGAGGQGGPTARGGSSSPGPCTSHTGAAGAPCSGRTHPGRRVSPEASEEEGEGWGGGVGGNTAGLNREFRDNAETPEALENWLLTAQDMSVLLGRDDQCGKTSAPLPQ